MPVKKDNKILVIGDAHFKDRLSYSDYIEDGREYERNSVLEFIVEQAKECSKVIFMGDNFNSRTNSPKVIKDFTNFIERFDDKEVFVLAGNHEKFADKRSAIDYLKEVKGKKWHIITNSIEVFGDLVFLPWLTQAELETNDKQESTKKIMKMLSPGKILFHHYAVSGSKTNNFLVDNFPEPILDKMSLERKYKLVVGGHIHAPTIQGRTIVTGSVFTNEIGEEEKFVWIINEDTLNHRHISLPGRPIYKLEIEDSVPDEKEWKKFNKKGIIKAIIKNKKTTEEIEEIKKRLEEFDAHILIENLPRERKKMHIEKGKAILEFSVEQLLELYAKERNVSFDLLKKGFELVRI